MRQTGLALFTKLVIEPRNQPYTKPYALKRN